MSGVSTKILKDQLAALKFMIDNGIDTDIKKCKENFLPTVLYDILSMAVEVDQPEHPTEITECRKVVKLRRMNCNIDIMRKTHPEALVFEGIYLIADGIFLPREVMDSIGYDTMSKKWGRLDTSSLPTGYAYSTLRDIGDGCGFALKNDEVAENINYRSISWEYFSVADYLY